MWILAVEMVVGGAKEPRQAEWRRSDLVVCLLLCEWTMGESHSGVGAGLGAGVYGGFSGFDAHGRVGSTDEAGERSGEDDGSGEDWRHVKGENEVGVLINYSTVVLVAR